MLLYGSAATNLTIRINYHKAHVVFYGDYHEQLATGFSINYKAYRGTSSELILISMELEYISV
jgi:hypothetical protein